MAKEKTNIPTTEEFARAERLMAERNRVEASVKHRVRSRFRESQVQQFFLFQERADFRAYVFVPSDQDLHAEKADKLRDQVRETVLDALEAEGVGRRETIALQIEMDSHENVQRKFNGDYYKRFR